MAEATQAAGAEAQTAETPVTEFEVAELQTTGDEQSGPAATPEPPVPAEEKEELKRVLLIAAHPDDPEFGCGGTMAKWANTGKEITYILLTSGDKGSRDPNLRPGQLATRREEEQRAAAKETGVQEVIFLRHPDGLLDNTLELRRQLVHYIRRLKPHIVVALIPGNITNCTPITALPARRHLTPFGQRGEWHIFGEQLQGDEEPWRTKEVYLFWTDNTDYWEDVTDGIDKRIAALACHVSQVGTDRQKLDERIRERSRKAGEEPGFAYAEGFKLIKF